MREELTVFRAAGAIDVAGELLELRGIAQLQADDDVGRLAGRQLERRRRTARHQLRAGQKGLRMRVDPVGRSMGRAGGEHERQYAGETAG